MGESRGGELSSPTPREQEGWQPIPVTETPQGVLSVGEKSEQVAEGSIVMEFIFVPLVLQVTCMWNALKRASIVSSRRPSFQGKREESLPTGNYLWTPRTGWATDPRAKR